MSDINFKDVQQVSAYLLARKDDVTAIRFAGQNAPLLQTRDQVAQDIFNILKKNPERLNQMNFKQVISAINAAKTSNNFGKYYKEFYIAGITRIITTLKALLADHKLTHKSMVIWAMAGALGAFVRKISQPDTRA